MSVHVSSGACWPGDPPTGSCRPGGRRTSGGRRTTGLLAAVAIATGALAACGGGDPPTIVEGDLAFVGVNVLPMDRDRVLENQTVVIADGRITAIDAAERLEPAEGWGSSRATAAT